LGSSLAGTAVLFYGHNAPCGALQRVVILACDVFSHHAFTVAARERCIEATKKSSMAKADTIVCKRAMRFMQGDRRHRYWWFCSSTVS
jgi:hypothetical protein